MIEQINFATKNDFLYACVVAAVLAVSAAGLFDELRQPVSDILATVGAASRLHLR